MTRAVEWRRRRRRRRSRAGILLIFFLGSLGLFLWAVNFGSLSLRAPDSGSTEADAPSVRDGYAGVTQAGEGQEASTEEDSPDAGSPREHPAARARLAGTPRTEKRNVVLVHLESTRARSVTPYNEDLNTTPFLNELAKSSLLVERAYVGSIPRSFMSSIAINCGIQAPAKTDTDDSGVMPVPCLAGLLGDQGYNTALFSSNADKYGDSATIDWGYEKAFAPPEEGVPPQHWSMDMDTERFAHTAFYGYEEDILLQPSENWLKEHRDEPFLVEYLTNTGHDEYNCLDTRYGSEDFSEDDLLNHYLNCLRLQDIFLQNLFDQYQELGLYDNTIFVLFGDHGEGLGEHGRFLHGDTIWEEGLRVPLIIHAPGWFDAGERVEGLSNYTDVLPTVLEMLGYEVRDGEYPGYSLLHEPPEDRTLFFSCISNRECLASIKGTEKYIYHYSNQPEEVYDLSQDLFEEHNLADEYSREELEKRREELFAWLSRIEAQYYGRGSDSGNGQSEENTRPRDKQSEGQPSGSTVAVGQPLTVGDVEWTVTSAYPADRLTSYVDGRTKRGNFVVVDFRFKNNSDEDLTLSSHSPVLFDGSGRRFEFDTDTYLYIDWAKNIFRRSVVPGDSPEGRVIFKVPPDASQFQLRLGEETPFSNKIGYVDLGF